MAISQVRTGLSYLITRNKSFTCVLLIDPDSAKSVSENIDVQSDKQDSLLHGKHGPLVQRLFCKERFNQ